MVAWNVSSRRFAFLTGQHFWVPIEVGLAVGHNAFPQLVQFRPSLHRLTRPGFVRKSRSARSSLAPLISAQSDAVRTHAVVREAEVKLYLATNVF